MFKRFLAFSIGLFTAIAPYSAHAGPEDAGAPRYLSYEEAVQLALHDNADLLALREQEDSLKFRSQQALAPNNPVFTYTKADVPGFSLTQQAAQEVYGVTFTLGFPGKALSQSASIRHQAEAASEQGTAKEIDISTALSNNYVALAINEAFYQFLLDEQKRDKELVRLLEKKFAASQAAKVDLLNAEVVTQTIVQNLIENRNQNDVLLTQFRQLIRRPEARSLFPKIPETIAIPKVKQSVEELSHIMDRNRHALVSTRKLVEGAQSALTGAALTPLPDLQLGAAVNTWNYGAGPVPGVSRDYTLSIGIAVPIFLPFNELPAIKAARHDLLSCEYQLESQRIQAIADLRTLYTNLEATQRALENMQKVVLPAAKASYDLTLLTYSLGKTDYFRLNESRRLWLDAQRDLLTRRQNAAQLYNQLIAQVGCDISKSEGPHACR